MKLQIRLNDISSTGMGRPDACAGHDAADGIATAERARFHAEYELLEALGSGTLSVVRLGRRRSDGRAIAVKCLRTEDVEQRRSTYEEYELLRELQHPSIIRALAIHAAGPDIWLCLELAAGGCVESRIQRCGAFGEVAAQHLIAQLLRGVHHLHRKRIVHRDLKPANLLLSEDNLTLKITDFNSAKRIGGGAGCSNPMLTDRGTHLFSAPELRFGRVWNERVDIWASGLSAYFMLKATLPFNIQSRRVLAVLLSGRLPDLSWGSVSLLMRNIVQQCLTVDMRDRPPAMELLQHPVFEQGPGQSSERPSDLNTEVADQVQETSHTFTLLPSCGLLSMHPMQQVRRCMTFTQLPSQSLDATPPLSSASASTRASPSDRWDPQVSDWSPAVLCPRSSVTLLGNLRNLSGMSQAWKESRDGVQVLRQLAKDKCVRAMEEVPAELAAAPTASLESLSEETLVVRNRRKVLTTHCAAHFAFGEH